MERVIETIRRECLDPVIIFGERDLRCWLKLFLAYYHQTRTHLSLDKDAPEPRPVQDRGLGRVISMPEVGGLHHRYERRAANSPKTSESDRWTRPSARLSSG